MKKKYELYWEDINESVIFAEQDDLAWQIPEKFYNYKKRDSLYIFHSNKLAAYYSLDDLDREAKIGYKYLKKEDNIKEIVQLKKDVNKKTENYLKNSHWKTKTGEEFKKCLLESLDIFRNSLGTHYLSQPQFFSYFEKENLKYYTDVFSELTKARLEYTRAAWRKAMVNCQEILKAYADRLDFTDQEIASATYNEIKNNSLDKKILQERAQKYVLKSTDHDLKILTGKQVDYYIHVYENFDSIVNIKGISGNPGVVKGKAYVIKNEFLDFKKLPKGMGKGMILISQNAWPELAPFYTLASGLVTNEGGITSHGVVVARELGIPCVVGTKIATKVLKDGDLVEVDADKGMVKILERV